MKKIILTIVTSLFALVLFIACGNQNQVPKATTISQDSLISRGNYLVNITGCGDCHSPKIMTQYSPMPDTTKLLSGFNAANALPPLQIDAVKKGWALFNAEGTAMVSPLGVSFAANLTSDETGIGNWSFQQFKTAMTKGKWKGLENSRDLLPPMPWMNFKHMSEVDLQSIFAYLKSTKPIKNIVPAPQTIALQ